MLRKIYYLNKNVKYERLYSVKLLKGKDIRVKFVGGLIGNKKNSFWLDFIHSDLKGCFAISYHTEHEDMFLGYMSDPVNYVNLPISFCFYYGNIDINIDGHKHSLRGSNFLRVYANTKIKELN